MASSLTFSPSKTDSVDNQEFLEVKSVSLEWKLSNLKHIFDTSKGDSKSKCVKSLFFGDGKWQVFFYPNSGHDQYCSLYLSCQPTNEEIDKASVGNTTISAITPIPASAATKPIDPAQVAWHREGLFKFTFEIKSLDRRTTYKTMEANDHAFSHEARNWGWAQYWRRNDAYYCNPSAKYNDAFLICCTIVYSPSPPLTISPTTFQKRSIPLDLLQAYSSLFNDPTYADVCFHIVRPSTSFHKSRVRKLYASKKILCRRSEYFADMFQSGFAESTKFPDYLPPSSVQHKSEAEEQHEPEEHEGDEDELMNEDSDDEDSEDESVLSTTDDSPFAPPDHAIERAVSSLDVRAPARDDGGGAQADEASELAMSTLPGDIPKPISRHKPRINMGKDIDHPARTVVQVTDAAYTTFKALLFFLYTDSITFAPLTSTYRCLRDAAEAAEQRFEYPSRRAFVRATVGGPGSGLSSGGVNSQQENVACSAKAIYRLADKLDLGDLKSRAYEHITRSLTVQNIPLEVFSAFTTSYAEIRKIEVEYMLLHWNELRESESLRRVLKVMPGFPEVWAQVLAHLEYRGGALSSSSGSGGASGHEGAGGGQVSDGGADGQRSIDAA